jgi:uncharacterized protein (TIGR02301 family)
MTAFARFSRLSLLALALGWAGQAVVPARAQFFQFFDNRPTKRPNSDFWGRRQDNGWGRSQDNGWGWGQDDGWGGRRQERGVEFRPRHRPHHEKPRAADKKPKAPEPPKTETAKAAGAPVAEGPPPAYEPQLLRLSEIMGALAYLQTLCDVRTTVKAGSENTPWRAQMENLMTAEGAGPSRREKLAGAYNRGLHGYEYSYRVCTPNAKLARERFLTEGAQLAHDISAQYRAN